MSLRTATSIMKMRYSAKAERYESKNYDLIGPEGQIRAVNSTMCNAGFPPWLKVFVISLGQVKVSMKKKKKREISKEMGGATRLYIGGSWPVRSCKFFGRPAKLPDTPSPLC